MMWRRLGVAALVVALAGSAAAEQMRWEPQLREMGYLFLHLSNINVVNGLNLKRDQAVKLYRLARQVEAVAARPPSLKARLCPELEGVRKTWLEARALLVQGKQVPEELERRVNLSRATESRVVRTMVRTRPIELTTRCVACHCAPRSGSAEPMTLTPELKRLADRAHAEGLYGKRGLVKLFVVSTKVDSLLTEGQKAILGDFSCCLVPPRDLSDPVRAGQAESNQKAIELMRKVRQCPEGFWPLMRAAILKKVDDIAVAARPGSTMSRKAAVRERIAQTLDRVRAMSDVQFEMDRERLAKDVKAAIVPTQSGGGPLKAAYFLLIPGSSRVYATYIRRLGRGEALPQGGEAAPMRRRAER